MAASEVKDKLKILCIHGYRQNGLIFKERTGAFRKLIKKFADVEFITAPNIVPPTQEGDGECEPTAEQRGWWFSREDDHFNASEDSDCVKGFDESLEIVKKALREQGPFDGLLGFSQGASFVAMLCGLRQHDPDNWPFHFAILIAGFKSRSRPHNYLYSQLVTIPTLHVFGDTDKVIPKDMSEFLLQYFVDPRIISHPGGHFVVASPECRPHYQEFLADMLREKQARKAT